MKKPISFRRQQCWAIITYTVLALLLTWPTAAQFTTHLPGDGGDDPAIAWNLWWLKYALLNEGQSPFQTNFMFYPIGINLGFYTLTVLNGLTSLPLLLNFGVVVASNLHMWLTLVVGGYGTYLLCRYFLADQSKQLFANHTIHWAALLGGLIYAFGSSRMFYIALGQFNIASTHWIPLAVLFFIKMHKEPKNLRWVWLTALFLVMQAWAELTYASFLIVFMTIYWAFWLIADHTRAVIRWPFIKATVLLMFMFGAGIAPFLGAIIPDMQLEGDFFVVDGGFADSFSSDLLGFLVPTMHHPLLGHFVGQTAIRGFDKGQQVYIGYVALCLAAVAGFTFRRKIAVWFWLVATLIFAWLMLGPQILINGWQSGLPGPFTILQQLPIFNGNRYPSRFSVMLLLTLAPLTALGFAHLAQTITKQVKTGLVVLGVCLAGFILFENLTWPMPQSDMTIPEPYQLIAADKTDFTLLDIPFGWRNGFRISGAWTTGIMFGQFYQTLHQKPLLHGNTSRNPTFKFQYFAEAPIIDSLTLLETGYTLPAARWQSDQAYAADVLRFFNIKYIIVRSETPSYLNHPQATIPYIEAVLPVTRLHQASDLSVYQVDLPPLPTQVDLLTDSSMSNLYFGEGWGLRQQQMIVAQRKQVRLFVPLNGQAQTVRLRLSQLAEASNEMYLRLNGWQSEKVALQGQQQQITLTIPTEAVQAGLNEIEIQFQQTHPYQPVDPDITVISAGEEGGNLGSIYLNGVDVSPQQRGYNLVIVGVEQELLASASFDTFADPQASQTLAEFIGGAPEQAIIALVAKDEASNQLSQVAIDALQSVGSQVDIRGHSRASHAFIGTKAGDIWLEASDFRQRPVKLSTGLGITEPEVAAIFEAIIFEAVK